MVFCNQSSSKLHGGGNPSHNPYFNRWFSAISIRKTSGRSTQERHNPYFNRWFSAIINEVLYMIYQGESQSLF